MKLFSCAYNVIKFSFFILSKDAKTQSLELISLRFQAFARARFRNGLQEILNLMTLALLLFSILYHTQILYSPKAHSNLESNSKKSNRSRYLSGRRLFLKK
ncbi:hypothetical protein MCETHM1_00124 [Flavobacteriaceae bacterium]